jgi:enamine deaminase RidA (YjgF/YER057c/UK114 family)
MSIDDRLRDLGLTLPEPFVPHPTEAAVVHDGVVRISGQLPRIGADLRSTGRLGAEVSLAEGIEAARLCALNCLAVLRHAVGDLDRVERLLTVNGYVACTPEFTDSHVVIDAASRLFLDVLGEGGRHTRTVLGVAALARGASVEVEVVAAVRA